MAEALQVNQNSPQSREEIRRVKHIDQLNNALQQMVQLIRQKNMEEKRTHFSKLKAQPKFGDTPSLFVDNSLIYLDAHMLAEGWETQCWRRTWEEERDLDSYIDQMNLDIMDLEMWVDHFDTELEGYNMFQEHFFRYFGRKDKYLKATSLSTEFQDASTFGVKPVVFVAGTLKLAPTVSFFRPPHGAQAINDGHGKSETIFGAWVKDTTGCRRDRTTSWFDDETEE